MCCISGLGRRNVQVCVVFQALVEEMFKCVLYFRPWWKTSCSVCCISGADGRHAVVCCILGSGGRHAVVCCISGAGGRCCVCCISGAGGRHAVVCCISGAGGRCCVCVVFQALVKDML